MMEQELRVRVLGGTELAMGGRPLVELASAKAAALVVYLAVTGTGHSRSALAGLLWSDLPEATARANLRLVLTKLRLVEHGHISGRQAVKASSGQRAHAARDAAHCSPRSRQISVATSTKGKRASGGRRSGCQAIPSRRGGGAGRMGMTATLGSFSSTVSRGNTA